MLRYTQDTWKAANTQPVGRRSVPGVGSNWNQPGKSLVAQLNQNIGSHDGEQPDLLLLGEQDRGHARRGRTPSWSTRSTPPCPRFYASDVKQQGGAAQPLFWGAGGYGNALEPGPLAEQPGPLRPEGRLLGGVRQALRQGRRAGSFNKKNEEPDNTSQESVHFNGTSGFLGPNGYQTGLNTGNALADLLLHGHGVRARARS